jgi:hypothetical protein
MQIISHLSFTTVKTEGALLPADILQRIADGRDLEGLTPASYHLAANERLNEAINRAWSRVLGAWQGFTALRERLADSDAGTTLTRERWLLILFQELGYGRLAAARGLEVEGVSYPISHMWQQTPIHLVTFRQELDRRGEYTGAIRRSPHSLLQEFLNRSESHLWGFVSNGLKLRLLRDNASLTRAAFVEFGLESMLQGELYAEFALLWLVCHQSRVETLNGDPADCWLERWSKTAAEQGTRALETLRQGVQEAIEALGRGLLAHPANIQLREHLRSGKLSVLDYYRQLLRLVYRLIILSVAEDRDLLLLPGTPSDIRLMYQHYYSLHHLRELAAALHGGPHPDLWCSLRLLFAQFDKGLPALGLPALGGLLFSANATPDLDITDLANEHLLNSLRALCYTVENSVRRPVDYRNLGSEELGSVYESLLELQPQLNLEAATFDLNVVSGSERKTTGSYYTPSSLIRSLLDSALEPVVEDRLADAKKAGASVEKAILAIRVCDPACGSGHFLIAAAHRLARHLARARSGDEEPAPAALRDALRDVVRHSIYGVDLNPMAVELCKVALWLETLDPGKPLGFLDANIQCGNSLMGAEPELIAQGLPDEAFSPITGDDKAVCQEYRKKNKTERVQGTLFDGTLRAWEHLGNLAANVVALEELSEETAGDVRAKEELYAGLVRSQDYLNNCLLADAWCAGFLWRKDRSFDYPITSDILRQIERNPYACAPWMREEIRRLAERYHLLHWHLTFPQVFGPQGMGGFDVVLGNPPWEQMQLDDREYFAAIRPNITNAPNMSARDKAIKRLAGEDPVIYAAYQDAVRYNDGLKHFTHASGRFPLTSFGRINLAPLFAELARKLISPKGRSGIIVPTGIATDSFNQYFFADLIDRKALASLYDFENRGKLFPSVDSRMKFCLLTIVGAGIPRVEAEFIFFAQRTDDLRDFERRFTLSASDINLLNPNTRTCPIFRSQRDAKLTKAIYRRVPALVNEALGKTGNPWGFKGKLMFMMNTDSHLFRTRA